MMTVISAVRAPIWSAAATRMRRDRPEHRVSCGEPGDLLATGVGG